MPKPYALLQLRIKVLSWKDAFLNTLYHLVCIWRSFRNTRELYRALICTAIFGVQNKV